MKTKHLSSKRRFLVRGLLLGTTITLLGAAQSISAQWSTASGTNNIYYNGGNVGIGTSSPQAKLDVQGSSTYAINGIFSAIYAKGTADYPMALILDGAGTNDGVARMRALNNGATKWQVNYADDVSFYSWINNTFLNTVTFKNNGNVGIGTSTPGVKLEVSGTPATSGNLFKFSGADSNGNLFNEIASTGIGGAILKLSGGSGTPFYLQSTGSGSGAGNNKFVIGTASSGLFSLQSDGNVGIGTTTPGYKLDVAGIVNSSTGGFRFPDGSVQTTAASGGGGAVPSVFGRTGAVVAATNDYTWAQINKTTSSLADLTTRSASDLSSGTLPDARFPATLPSASGANLTTLNASSLASGTVATARLGGGTANATTFLRGDNTWAVPSGGSQWNNGGSSSISYNAGSVGIGTNAPSDALEVSGNLKVSGTGNINATGTITGGNIVAKYQDVAEWVPSSQWIPSGTVVVLDTTRSNQVISSTQRYDTRVAGVISEQPGIALGESGANKVLVATTGRVLVNVEATTGPIHIGDLLVTSDISGAAMKSEPITIGNRKMHMPGTLIGKALEPLEKGSGKILVLLSLQ